MLLRNLHMSGGAENGDPMIYSYCGQSLIMQ